jgi:hypothetical protein
MQTPETTTKEMVTQTTEREGKWMPVLSKEVSVGNDYYLEKESKNVATSRQ